MIAIFEHALFEMYFSHISYVASKISVVSVVTGEIIFMKSLKSA